MTINKKRTNSAWSLLQTGALLLVLVPFLMLAGCALPAGGTTGQGDVSFSIDPFATRTVQPTDLSATVVSSYTVAGTGPSGATLAKSAKASSTFTVSGLTAGAWVFTVEGLNSAGTVVATGTSASVTVAASTTASATVALVPGGTGTGTFTLSVTLPSAASVNALTGTITPVGGLPTPFSATISGGTATFTKSDLAVGSYTLALYGKTTDNKYWTNLHALKIYSGLTSPLSITSLTASSFLPGVSVPADPTDPATGLPVAIPAALTTAEKTIVTTGALALDAAQPGVSYLSVSGLINPTTLTPYDSLNNSNFTLIDTLGSTSVVKGINVERISTSSTAGQADIVFIIDTTGSMSGTITGVKSSVINFLNYLRTQALDIRVAGYAFSDVIVESRPFSPDLTTTGTFYSWVNGLSASYKGDSGGDTPENPMTSIAHGVDNLSWRTGAQKIFIVLTDAAMHYAGDGSAYTTWTADTLYSTKLSGKTVHVVGPNSTGTYQAKYLATLTGGSFTAMPSSGSVDLTTLPISSVIASGYRITFRTSTPTGTHMIRLIYVADATNKGEFTLTQVY